MTVNGMKPVGPIADAWRVSRAFIAGIMGPVGSGKTSTGVAKCFHIAAQQPAVRTANGDLVRYARGAVIRDTYPNLDSTVLATWHQWVPREIGRYAHDAPRRHVVRVKLTDGTFLHLEMLFIAIGDKRVEDVLRGLELTFAWLNEADRLSQEVLAYLTGRVGRYPGPKRGGCVSPTIFMDFNAPDTDNWLYRLFVDGEVDKAAREALEKMLGGRPLVEFFQQPGAREPGAENIKNLPTGYYDMQYAAPSSAEYKARMLDNKFVPLRHGQPVFPEFSLSMHMAPGPIGYDSKRKLVVGMDAGLTPAAVFTQRDSLGRFKILAELLVFPETEETIAGVGPTRFAQAVRQFIGERFPEIDLVRPPRRARIGHNGGPPIRDLDDDGEGAIRFVCDPSAKDGTDTSGNERSWLQIVQGELGHKVHPAKTNRLHVRLEALRRPLVSMVDGGLPAFQLDPRCKVLRKAYLTGYHFRRVAVGDGTGRFNVEPEKNMFSHGMDAAQYAAMDDGAAIAAIMGKARKPRRNPQASVSYGSDYFSGGQ